MSRCAQTPLSSYTDFPFRQGQQTLSETCSIIQTRLSFRSSDGARENCYLLPEAIT